MARRPVRGERQPWSPVSEDAIPAAPRPGAQTGVPGSGRPPRIPAQADTTPLVTSMKPPRPGLQPEPYAVSNVYLERERLNTLRVTNPGYYDRIVSELRATDLLGPNANSESAIDEAYRKLLKAAAGSAAEGMPVTPQEARNIIAGIGQADSGTATGGRGRGGRASAYTGPVQSIAVQAESDINASADAIAIELLGRGATKEEKDRIVKRIRKAETSQPQVSTSTPGMNVTREGLTSQGREDILRQVLSKNPDFVDYQLDTTVMDFMLEDIDRGKRVANV